MSDDAVWGQLREALAADVRRVSERLRSLSATRLAAAPGPPEVPGGAAYGSRGDAGRAAAVALARAAWALEAHPEPGPPPLPALPDFAVGDQVAVTGHDLLAAMGERPPAAESVRAVQQALAVLTDVRRRL